jgi:DNA-directed RNA polymerase subunit K/omega
MPVRFGDPASAGPRPHRILPPFGAVLAEIAESWYDSLLMGEDVLTPDEQVLPETPAIPDITAPPITDRFLFVDVAAMRAKQLRRGARPRLGEQHDAREAAPAKPERVAMEEVRRGLVQYEVPQFKAHVAETRV